ncbi:hypothetical protein HG530_015489 [Fusarium avenaceum]|nr:hypothetical protein HG530_015489 [Fusarium avenaceum]
MVPCAGITIQHGRCFDELLAVWLAPFTFECLMGVTLGVRPILEQLAQAVKREMSFDIFRRVDDTRRQTLLVRLSLKDLLFDGTGCNEAVDETIFLLSITPHSSQCLLIGCGVPIRVKQDKTVRTNKIDTASAGFAAEQEDKFIAFRIIETIDKLLALVDIHGTIKTETSVLAGTAHSFEKIKRGSIVADQYNFIIRVLTDASQHAI